MFWRLMKLAALLIVLSIFGLGLVLLYWIIDGFRTELRERRHEPKPEGGSPWQ